MYSANQFESVWTLGEKEFLLLINSQYVVEHGLVAIEYADVFAFEFASLEGRVPQQAVFGASECFQKDADIEGRAVFRLVNAQIKIPIDLFEILEVDVYAGAR